MVQKGGGCVIVSCWSDGILPVLFSPGLWRICWVPPPPRSIMAFGIPFAPLNKAHWNYSYVALFGLPVNSSEIKWPQKKGYRSKFKFLHEPLDKHALVFLVAPICYVTHMSYGNPSAWCLVWVAPIYSLGCFSETSLASIKQCLYKIWFTTAKGPWNPFNVSPKNRNESIFLVHQFWPREVDISAL